MEPLGRSQVLPYLLSLAKQGIRLEVLSFEKSKDLEDSSRSLALEKELKNNPMKKTIVTPNTFLFIQGSYFF